MWRSTLKFWRGQSRRGFCTEPEKIIASVLFERLPVVTPKIDPVVYAFQEFSFRWRQQFRRRYPDEFLESSEARAKSDYQIDYTPAPRITEADKAGDRKSLNRALDRRLYLLLYGNTSLCPKGRCHWHFPQKEYENEETLCKCAELALKSVLGDLSETCFLENAPLGHQVVPLNTCNDAPALVYKQFFFKSQVIAKAGYEIGKCEDYAWVTKDELLEYFPEDSDLFCKMIVD